MLSIERLKKNYKNEEVLIILFTRLYFGTEKVEEIKNFLANKKINWVLFYKLVNVNSIKSFIYESIRTAQLTIDQQIFDTLKKDTAAIILYGNYQTRLVTDLLKAFKKLGFTVIPYKGITLAQRYYKSIWMRESNDVDFLINPDDLVELKDFLISKGFTSKDNISAHQMPFLKKFHRELSFRAPKGKLGISGAVELQWRLLEYYFSKFCNYNFLIKHLRDDITETDHIGLAPTYDFLCVASHHLIGEPLLKFKYLVDLACMVETSPNQLNWKEIEATFKQHHYTPFLWSGLSALREIIGIGESLPLTPTTEYQLFVLTLPLSTRTRILAMIKAISSKLSFVERIKFQIKIYSWFLLPDVNDLSLTNAPAWTLPFTIPLKFFKLSYSYLFNNR